MNYVKQNLDLILFPLSMLVVAAVLHFGNIVYVSPLEFIGVMLSIISAMLIKREIVFGMVLSIIAQIAFIIYFWQLLLYGQALLGLAFICTSLIAIYFWKYGGEKRKELHPSWLRHWQLWLIILLIGAMGAIGYYFGGYFRMLDLALLSTGLIGAIIIAFKKVEAWAFWIFGDILCIFLFMITGSWLLLARVFIFMYNNGTAFLRWRRQV